jgi:uncharacterized protein YjbI with pentapeptide repeats
MNMASNVTEAAPIVRGRMNLPRMNLTRMNLTRMNLTRMDLTRMDPTRMNLMIKYASID